MYPYFYRRAPSRLLWFAVGAATATYYLKRNDERRISFWCKRLVLGPNDLPQNSSEDQGHWKTRATQLSRAINNLNPAERDTSPPWDEKDFQQRREHFAKVSRQAGEAVSDMTESSLDTLISAADAMRSKLIMHRRRRELEDEKHRQNSVVEQADEHRNSTDSSS